MIRWSYVVPRLVIAAAAVLLLWLGMDPLIRWWIEAAGESITGAKVEVEDVETSVIGGTVRVSGLEVANPGRPEKNLFQAERASLELDSAALWRRKFIVNEGRVTGLRIDTDRDSSGALTPAEEAGRLGEQLADLGLRWLKQVAELLYLRVEEEFQTPALARELLARWPAEFQRIEDRVESLRRKIFELRAYIENPGLNPLRDMASFRRAASDVESVEQELRLARRELESLLEQAGFDRTALREARRRDMDRIQRLMTLDGLDADGISQYLLGPEYGRRVADIIRWIEWVREHAPAPSEEPKPERARGEYVVFKSSRRDPEFLIRRLHLDGEGELDGKQLQFTGTASGLTNRPKLHGKPAIIRLETTGAAKLVIEANLDRTGDRPHDRYVVSCPAIERPARSWGDAEHLALEVSPGNAALRAELQVKGERLRGEVVFVRENLRLTARLSEQFGGEEMAEKVTQAVSGIDEINVSLKLSGTVKYPKWELRSDLGEKLSDGINGAFQAELAARREALAARAEEIADEQLAMLEELLREKQEQARQTLLAGDAELARLSERIARRLGLPDHLRPEEIRQALFEGRLPERFRAGGETGDPVRNEVAGPIRQALVPDEYRRRMNERDGYAPIMTPHQFGGDPVPQTSPTIRQPAPETPATPEDAMGEVTSPSPARPSLLDRLRTSKTPLRDLFQR